LAGDVEVDDTDAPVDVFVPVAFFVLLPVAAPVLLLDVAGAAMALVRSRVRVPNAPSKWDGTIASTAAEDGGLPLIAHMIF